MWNDKLRILFPRVPDPRLRRGGLPVGGEYLAGASVNLDLGAPQRTPIMHEGQYADGTLSAGKPGPDPIQRDRCG